jgi:hypothetical protein
VPASLLALDACVVLVTPLWRDMCTLEEGTMGKTFYVTVVVLLAATQLGFVIVLTRRAQREGLPRRHYLDVGIPGTIFTVLSFALVLLLLAYLLHQAFRR